ncbi:MAG: signal peptide peptidase SppA [Planctomycetaceae bacterium]
MRFLISLLLTVSLMALANPSPASTPAEQPVLAPKPAKVGLAHIRIKGSLAEGAAQEGGLFSVVTERLADMLARLEKAGDDKNISGIVLEIKSPTIGWARANDLRQAINRVRAKGKKVYAVLESAETMDYLLATACDEIIMPESGMVTLLGLRAEISFYKNLFDKVSLKAEMLRVGEYKSAGEPYTRTEMSPEFRKEMEEIIDDLYAHLVQTVADGRKLDKEKVQAAIDAGPHTAKAALEWGLIDRIAYDDELEDVVRAGNPSLDVKVTKDYGKKKIDTDFSGFAGMVKMMNMMMGGEPAKRTSQKTKIAVIYAEGAIMSGPSTADLFGESVMGSDTMVKAIRTANDDPKVKAIVLRVNSPGGSALASDLIWRALEKVDKPFVVSMGDVAGSGGYYISMGADRIFAEPATITGSIGVVGLKIALKGLYEKVGINTTVISRGKNSGVMSSLDAYNDDERAALQKSLDEIYGQFTRKAAQGRKMPHDELEKLARGRVYTGVTALKHGLVDELGTLEDAIAYATKKAGLKPEDKVERLELPKARSPFEALFGSMDEDAQMSAGKVDDVMRVVAQFAPEIADHIKAAALAGMLARDGRLTLMPFRITVK